MMQPPRRGGGGPPRKVEPPIVNGRVPPHDLDAEAAVLSAILLSRDALDRVQEILKPEHFYSDANGRIYNAAQELALAGTPVPRTRRTCGLARDISSNTLRED